jgi:hypothetical protein
MCDINYFGAVILLRTSAPGCGVKRGYPGIKGKAFFVFKEEAPAIRYGSCKSLLTTLYRSYNQHTSIYPCDPTPCTSENDP